MYLGYDTHTWNKCSENIGQCASAVLPIAIDNPTRSSSLRERGCRFAKFSASVESYSTQAIYRYGRRLHKERREWKDSNLLRVRWLTLPRDFCTRHDYPKWPHSLPSLRGGLLLIVFLCRKWNCISINNIHYFYSGTSFFGNPKWSMSIHIKISSFPPLISFS